MTSGVYQILNTVNGKCYVGSSMDVHNRIRRHKAMLRSGRHDSLKLTRAVSKYGVEVFHFEVLETCARDSNLEREAHWIGVKNSVKNGYNTRLVPNANTGLSHSVATRALLSEKSKGNTSAKGAIRSAETLARLSESHKNPSQKLRDATSARNKGNTYCVGYVHGPETRARMSESKRGKKQTPETIAKRMAPVIGTKYSPERVAKVVAANIGRTHSDESKEKMRAAKLGGALTAEHRAKISRAGLGRVDSAEARAKKSQAATGRVMPPESIAKRKATMAAKKASKRSYAYT